MGNITQAYNWAVNTCNRSDVGYSQAYRNQQTVDGITYYDCSSFVWYALQAGGFSGLGSYPFTTGTMRGILTKAGWTEYDSSATSWQKGDVVWRSGHTEMVYDDHITMGAHSANVPLADQVSIRSSAVSDSSFPKLLRPPGRPTPTSNPIVDNRTSLNWEYKVGVNAQLTQAQMENNAQIIYNECYQMGWTINAVAALLGNMQAESSVNPGQQETSGMAAGTDGTGLLQWTTPSGGSKNPLLVILSQLYGTEAGWYSGDKQMNAMFTEYQQTNNAQGHPDSKNWGVERQWYNSNGSRYGFSLTAMDWYDWAMSGSDVETLTKVFMVSYLRPAYDASVNHWQRRVEYAKNWLTFLGGVDPDPGGGGGGGNFSPSTSSEDGGGSTKVTPKEIIKAVQAILKACGYYSGEVDGLMGPKTRTALRKVGLK